MQNTVFQQYSPWELVLFNRHITGKPSAKQQANIDKEKQKMLEAAQKLAVEKLKMETGETLRQELLKDANSNTNKNIIIIGGALLMVIIIVFVALKMRK